MVPNVSLKPNNTNSIIGSRAYTFLDSYIYMKNQRYNALYEKNKEILMIENNAISIKSANVLYNAFLEEARILDSIVIRIRNFALRIKPDIIENINLLIPSINAINDFDNAISSNPDIPKYKYIHYKISPIDYENMASFINLYKMEINAFTAINTQAVNKDNPFIRDKATQYLIQTAKERANVNKEMLEMEEIKVINKGRLKNISAFFRHKAQFISTINQDFKTFHFYLRQYSGLREITSLMKPTELRNGDVLLSGSSKAISFNDYFVLYKHFHAMIKYMVSIISYHEQQFFNKIYGLQSNIESYANIVNEVLDYTEKMNRDKSDEDESLNESILFSGKDIYKDFDKFKNGESNILLITGLTGSGKSTLANKLASEHNAEYIELDILDPHSNMCTQGMDVIKKAGEVFYDFFQSHKNYYDSIISGKMKDEDIASMMDKFLEYCFSWCKKKSNKKFIIEGIQIYEYFNYYKKSVPYPLVVKNVSVSQSFIRKIKREEWSLKDVINNGPEVFKFMIKSDKDLKNIISSLNEAYDDGLINSNTLDSHNLINGNYAVHILMNDDTSDTEKEESEFEPIKHDSIKDVKDEVISNFNEYEYNSDQGGVEICTLRDSWKL